MHDSSESLFKPSQRKESFGIVLTELCGEVGAPLVSSNNYSTKVCKPCSRKIKKAAELVSELKSSVNALHPKFQQHLEKVIKKESNDIVRKENDDLTTQNPQIDSDEVLSKLNVDGLKTCEGRSCLKMKVLLVHPNGNVVTRNPTNEKTVQIIRNLLVGGWTAVANAVFDHSNETLFNRNCALPSKER